MSSTSSSQISVDLNAYAHNIRTAKSMIPPESSVMAVVKSEAYGHGAVPVARKAVDGGAVMLGVATVDEGIALREAGIDAPILLLVQPAREALAAALEHDLRLMISDVAMAEHVGELARRTNKVAPVHCKIDSGMGRQGFDIDKVVGELLFLTRISHIDIEGVATHFPVADSTRDSFTANQIRAFRGLIRQLSKSGIPYDMVHAANSAAVVNYPISVFDMVRIGLMTYGVWPTDSPPVSSPLRQVLRWETKITLVKDLEPGSSVGYGRTYTTETPMRVAMLPVGYADGYKHGLSNNADVLVHGKRCPVRGSISMNQIMVDVTQVSDVATGDCATLIGVDGDECITAEELAEHAQTIPYDILTGLSPVIPRDYVE